MDTPFGYTGGATISNVGLVNASVTGNYDVGALVGYLGGSSSITNAYAAGSVTGGTNGLHVGGLVGQVESGSSINGAYTAGTVIGGSNVGGLVGLNFGEINNAYATASAESYYGAVGGLVGSNGNKINNAYATGNVTGNTLFTSNIGGLVGARQTGSSIAASYWNTQTSGITDLSKGVGNQANASGVTGRTSDEMKNAANYSTWDTTAVWYLNGGYTAPLLRSFLTPLTVSADSVSKVYDGTATAALNNVAYSGSYNATKVGGTLAWDATRNVGSYGLGGLYTTSQQGYLIAYNPVSLLTITPRAVTGSVTAANKVYDGTTAATISGGITLDNKVVGDAVSATYASGDFADKHVGDNKSVTLAGLGLTGADAGNYTLAADSVTSSASITPATLTTTPLGTVEKVYDGTTLAQVNAGNQPLLQGSFAGDNVSLSFGLASASYDNKNVGDNKAVTLSGLTLGGADAGNYQLASTAITSNVGKITPASLTITASSNSKVYDGTLSAAATPTFSGLVGGDTVSGLAQAYTDKNAGSGKTLTVTGYAVNDGNGGNNYTVSLDNDTTGVITPAQLVYTAVAASREQDKDDPLLTGSISGVVAGESLSAITGGTLAWTAAATKNSPAGRYAITGSGLTVADTNYLATILQASGNAMALTVRAQQGGSGYKDLLPWIVQANHVTGNRLPEGVGAGADTSPDSTVRAVARYAAGDASSGNVGGGAVFGLPLNIVGSGVNVGGHRAVSPMLQISTQEERKPHAL